MSKSVEFLSFPRLFTQKNQTIDDVFNAVVWGERLTEIRDTRGEVKFSQSVDFPEAWSDTSVRITASKYFHGKLGSSEREHSLAQLIRRVVTTFAQWGVEQDYFDVLTARTFEAELAYILLHQLASFNSPVYFNVGIEEQPQCSACFILDVEDDMEQILDWYKEEGMVFKRGSGSGINLSKLRGSNEKLSGGGTASGPLSFMKAADASAGVIKSGGKTRRAAKMVVLNVDHPDIMKFIECKTREEQKAHVLEDAGYSGGIDGEAWGSVTYQNANNSVRVTDTFMQAVEDNAFWELINRTDGKVVEVVAARKVLMTMAENAWKSGDPGIQFDDAANKWHTSPASGRIDASNPCQPAFAPVLTLDGIRTFADIEVGSTIWSGQRWTKVTRKLATGIKLVFKYVTRAGIFYGTAEHRVVDHGAKVEVKDAEFIDISAGLALGSIIHDPAIVMDGLVLGDGWSVAPNGPNHPVYVVLGIGNDDQDYFTSEVGSLIEYEYDKKTYRIKTSLTPEELPRLFEREIPARYMIALPSVVCSLLRGLFSANGSVLTGKGRRIVLKTSSPVMRDQIQLLLSSVGISSYYTVYKEHPTAFSNGTYICKESYQVSISRDRWKFRSLIGFIQRYKNAKLDEICSFDLGPNQKTSFEIVETEALGEMPVWDIEVDAPEHTYWTGGLLVSNCSEYMHLSNTSCNLASINLLKFFGDAFDIAQFKHTIDLLVTAQDILIDRAGYPTAKLADNSKAYRELGLGHANGGALLMALGLPYDSDEGRAVVAALTSLMSAEGYAQSAKLARVKGLYDGLSVTRELVSNRRAHQIIIQMHAAENHKLRNSLAQFSYLAQIVALEAETTWQEALSTGIEFGWRNSQISVIAPTGTIGFFMGCDTTGGEPAIGLVTYKNLVGGGQLRMVNQTVARALTALGYSPEECNEIKRLIETGEPPENIHLLRAEHVAVFDCAFVAEGGTRSIAPDGHLKMMAAMQPFVSGAISKTINLPASATVQDIYDCFVKGWRLGLKALAVYRDGSKGVQPVSTNKSSASASHVHLDGLSCIMVDGFCQGTKAVKAVNGAGNSATFTHQRVGTWEGTVTPQPLPFTAPSFAMPFLTEMSTQTCDHRRRPADERDSKTHKFSIAGHDGYLTVGLFADGAPCELFVVMNKQGSTVSGLMDAWAITMSFALQFGTPLKFLVRKFMHVRFEPSGITTNPQIRFAKSLVDYIARWMGLKFLTQAEQLEIGLVEQVNADGAVALADASTMTSTVSVSPGAVWDPFTALAWPGSSADAPSCMDCGTIMIRNGTCYKCPNCGSTSGCS